MERRNSKRKNSKQEKVRQSTENSETLQILGNRDEEVPDFQEQYLFLMEFFIHHVTSDRLAKLNQMFFVPTTISVEFLNFMQKDDMIEITPVDPLFEPQAGVADDVEYFYSGRSVMFAISQQVVVNKVVDFFVNLCVNKKMPDGVKPDVLVGTAHLDLSKEFAALRKEMLQCWHKMQPPPRTFEGEVPLIYQDNVIGAICMFVRISGFGQSIVTEFESPPERTVSTYIFKGQEMEDQSLTYKCRIVDSRNADICRESMDELMKKGPPCRVCVKDDHPCTPCGRPTGATTKPNVVERQAAGADVQVGSEPRSRPEACNEVHKSGLIQTSRGPVQPCGKAVVLKVSGILDTNGDKKPTVTVAPESEAVGPDNCDPEHDVFVLRIGKKGLVGVGEKSDIQLEMKTPRGKEKGPPIRYETREMQTDEDKKKRKRRKKKKAKIEVVERYT